MIVFYTEIFTDKEIETMLVTQHSFLVIEATFVKKIPELKPDKSFLLD